MKKGLKKALGLLVALSLMVVGSAFSALAADSPEQRQTFSVDLNNFDETQPYSETLHFEKDGQPVTVTLSYTPPLTRDPATEGTWKSDAFWGVAGMDYRFDLSKSGSQWKISNARDLNTYCVGGTVEDESLAIGRATSTSSKAAEVTGSMRANVVGGVGTLSFALRTEVFNGEVSTVLN